MKTMLIVFHSLTGGTRQMAEAAARGGAAQAGIQVDLVEASKAGAADVLHADGYIFATPENLAAMAGMMKDFFDRTYYDALDRIGGRPYAILVCAGNGQNAVGQIEHDEGLFRSNLLRRARSHRRSAILVCAGNGQNAVRQIERIATGWRLRAI